MEEERIRVLQMLKEGKISVDESLKLLEALESTTAEIEVSDFQSAPKWLKVRITEPGKDKPKVMVNLPIALVDWALRAGNRFASLGGVNLDEMGVDLKGLREALVQGTKGKIIDVMDEDDGNHIEIVME